MLKKIVFSRRVARFFKLIFITGGAPVGAKAPDQSWDSEFEKYFINDVDSEMTNIIM